MVLTLWRCMSKNLNRRWQENERYLRRTEKFRAWGRLRRDMWQQRREYKFFKCPACKAVLRVPKGVCGNIAPWNFPVESALVMAVDMLAAGIRHHVEEEEQEVFPELRKKAAKELDGVEDGATTDREGAGSARRSDDSSGDEPTKEELLLAEIRDLLKEQSK